MEHKHHGKSSAKFLDSDEILSELNLNGNETFLDAGCGDGYISKKAIEKYLPEGKVYAVDLYSESIIELKSFVDENDIDNLIPVEADITKTIQGVDDESVDVVLMLNVFHGFKESGQREDVINELKRIIKSDGKIAIMEFKPIEMTFGPPIDVRISHIELEKIFNDYGLKKTYLTVDIGSDIGETKSHYLIIFEKE
ncbi:class I SAM-dependent methyltransferase [Methanobrevibacter sp.]|uniref:class I SAM-dependent methyltransferase n=1 Tax=Methanobrevibacter sp. TaxID=66852 RepID=UPI0025EDA39F|nr:class I SAM-dependent methyltransferase [Methanobrevibacter sp.]MBR4448114.1 class I SAM-dependent methyltransferase [Methanobrevibacter sp.]